MLRQRGAVRSVVGFPNQPSAFVKLQPHQRACCTRGQSVARVDSRFMQNPGMSYSEARAHATIRLATRCERHRSGDVENEWKPMFQVVSIAGVSRKTERKLVDTTRENIQDRW